ncbi:thioredoxin-dependent thiol peroxidase [Amorphus orientalis]|uniref:thioredoxin-dependent peroxiredoxin n=1 Tax=Amorphus orientalis TaxID=649198 RepID=A0AAE3VSP8_9HYPH|nr:thioredoxin-dependent thiol peroxidase [Amorphus orientalis]MDQ0317704.1 peroxiredoxin Q/BCP [Amorphus orientalis]
MATLSEGDQAPDFTLPTDTLGDISLSGLSGKSVVLYFYPKDDTPGCTKEAVGFSELLPRFSERGVEVIGISPDSVARHSKFRAKHELGVPLASDEDKSVCQSYGVWVEKSMYGRTYFGVERSTFLIAPDGTIAKIWRKVKVPGHAEAVLEAAEKL